MAAIQRARTQRRPALALCLAAALGGGCSGEINSDAATSSGAHASGGSTAALLCPLLRPAPRGEQTDSAPFDGFTLVAPLGSRRVHLIDMAGEEVHRWDTKEKAGESNYLTSRGTLIRCAETPDHPTFQDTGGHGGGIFEYGVNGEVLWEFRWDNESGLQHHDVEELPNGNFLFIAWDRTTRDVALSAGRDPELLEGSEWWTGAIYEVKPTRPAGGEIVWSWHSRDHLVQNYDASLPGYGDPAEFPGRIDVNGDRDPKPPSKEESKKLEDQMRAAGYAGGDDGSDDGDDQGDEESEEELDAEEAAREAAKKERKARTKDADWTHMNAVDYSAELDQIAISVRRFDEVWIIDHGISRDEAKGPAGDLLYRFGNAYAYGMGRWSERRFLGQHNVQWIPEGQIGAGNLIVFNNGASPRPWSSVVEWWPPLCEDGSYARLPGAPFGPSQYEWSYQAEDV
ncbi:MAG: aryl-sulfate sulfotransferase [Planctomycetota bacterium]